MKFKFDLDKKTLIRIGCIVLIIAMLPFSFELAFLIDLGGIDFAVAFLLLFLSANYNLLAVKWDGFKREVASFVVFLAELYMFKPRVFAPHVAVSGIIVCISCSVLLACLFWIPVMYVSSGFV